MKFAAAVLLGLATVSAENVFGQIDSVFDGTPSTVVSSGDLTIVQTLDWNFDYGTYFDNAVGSDLTGDFVSQYYGAFIEFYVSADYAITYGAWFEVELTSTFYPFYYVPAEIQVDLYRFILGAGAFYNPVYNFVVTSYYQLLFLETDWAEQVGVTDVSITDYLVNGSGNLYPDSASWALSSTSTITDPVYSGSVFDWVNNALGDPINFAADNSYVYWTYTLSL
jgi:hypothetical protein